MNTLGNVNNLDTNEYLYVKNNQLGRSKDNRFFRIFNTYIRGYNYDVSSMLNPLNESDRDVAIRLLNSKLTGMKGKKRARLDLKIKSCVGNFVKSGEPASPLTPVVPSSLPAEAPLPQIPVAPPLEKAVVTAAENAIIGVSDDLSNPFKTVSEIHNRFSQMCSCVDVGLGQAEISNPGEEAVNKVNQLAYELKLKYKADFSSFGWHGGSSFQRIIFQDQDFAQAFSNKDFVQAILYLCKHKNSDSKTFSGEFTFAEIVLKGLTENSLDFLLTASPNWEKLDTEKQYRTRDTYNKLGQEYLGYIRQGLTHISSFLSKNINGQEIQPYRDAVRSIDEASIGQLLNAIHVVRSGDAAASFTSGTALTSQNIAEMSSQFCWLGRYLDPHMTLEDVLSRGLASHALDGRHIIAGMKLIDEPIGYLFDLNTHLQFLGMPQFTSNAVDESGAVQLNKVDLKQLKDVLDNLLEKQKLDEQTIINYMKGFRLVNSDGMEVGDSARISIFNSKVKKSISYISPLIDKAKTIKLFEMLVQESLKNKNGNVSILFKARLRQSVRIILSELRKVGRAESLLELLKGSYGGIT